MIARAAAADPPPDPTATWATGADGAVVLAIAAPDGSRVLVDAEARFAGLTTTWRQGPFDVVAGTVTVRIEPPPEAWLHDLAADYLTGLRVRVVDAAGPVLARAPNAFLAWPQGSGGPVEVWDGATARERAPYGVVSAALRATLPPDLPADTWLLPPVVLESLEVE